MTYQIGQTFPLERSQRIKPPQPTGLWFAMRVRSGGEEAASEDLEEAGCEVWVPKFKTMTKPTKKRRPTEVMRPLMPGYVFARVPFGGWSSVSQAKSVIGWVAGLDGQPLPCRREAEVRNLREAERLGLHDDDKVEGRIAPGDLLEILFGPFEGFMIRFKAFQGTSVEGDVEIFGRHTRVVIPAHEVKLSR